MATIKISRAVSGGAALDYAQGKNKLSEDDRQWLQDHGINPTIAHQLRDRAVASGGLNVDLTHTKGQMRATRELFGNRGKTQVMRVIQSFSQDDLSASNPADWQRANDLGVELGRRMAPNHEIAVYTHLDGEGHKLHNHIIINMPNLKTGKKYQQNNDWERVCAIANDISQENGLSVIPEKDQQRDRRTMAERKRKAQGRYVWKDDLRERINAVMQSPVSSYKAFSDALTQKGVAVFDRGKDVSYKFLDDNSKQHRSRGEKLGSSYTKEAITNELGRRTKQLGQIHRRYERRTAHARSIQQGTTEKLKFSQRLERSATRGVKALKASMHRFRDSIEQFTDSLQRFTSRLRQLKSQDRLNRTPEPTLTREEGLDLLATLKQRTQKFEHPTQQRSTSKKHYSQNKDWGLER